jgi:hypothetical protein
MSHVLSLVALVVLADAASAAGPLDLIPHDAVLSLSIRNLNELKAKGDKLLADKDIDRFVRDRLLLGTRPSELFDKGYECLGVENSVDRDGSAAIFLANPKILNVDPSGLEILQLIVVALPFRDVDKMAASLGLEKGALKPDVSIGLAKPKFDFFRVACVHGKHVYLGNRSKVIDAVVKARRLSDELPAARRKTLEAADVLLHGSPLPWRDDWKSSLSDWERNLRLTDPREQAAAHQLAQALEQLRYAFVGFRVDDGVGFHFATVFNKDGAAAVKEFLTALRGGPGASDLKGLPTGRVLAAYAERSNGAENAVVARVLARSLLRDVFQADRILSPADRPLVIGVFSEIWKRVQGQRIGLYVNADPAKHGQFSSVMILDADDPKKLLEEVRELARFAEGKNLDLSEAAKKPDVELLKKLVKDLGDDSYQVRETAQTKLALLGDPARPFLEEAVKSDDAEVRRRADELLEAIKSRAELLRKEALDRDLPQRIRPGFVLTPRAETLDGQSLDVVNIRLGKEDASAVAQMKDLLGPDWAKIRVATIGKQVVVLMGSDLELLKQAIKNVKSGAAGLAGDERLASLAKHSSAGRKAELHLALAAVEPLLTSGDLSKVQTAAALTSFALLVDVDRLELDLWLPINEIKALVKQNLR